jgi:hypothetical protein
VPHPFRFFLRKGWDTNEIRVYTISENALGLLAGAIQRLSDNSWLPRKKSSLDGGNFNTAVAKRPKSARRTARQAVKCVFSARQAVLKSVQIAYFARARAA